MVRAALLEYVMNNHHLEPQRTRATPPKHKERRVTVYIPHAIHEKLEGNVSAHARRALREWIDKLRATREVIP